MNAPTQWHGKRRDQLALLRAVSHNCTCKFEMVGKRVSSCSVHCMLVEDQRALNGLLFGLHLAERLRREEGLSE